MTRTCQSDAPSASLDSSRVTLKKVALIPPCEECRKLWLPGDDERWQAYWVDDGPEELLLFYCPDCAEREFSQTL